MLVRILCSADAKRKSQERVENNQRNCAITDVDTLHFITDKNIFETDFEGFRENILRSD